MRRINADWRDASLYAEANYLLADPPWNYEYRPPKADAQVGAKYSTWGNNMTGNGGAVVNLFGMLPVRTAVVFMWCTWSLLEEVISIPPHSRYCKAQDAFTLRTAITWIKLKNRGGLAFGLGNSARGVTEPLLVYVRKSVKPPRLQIPNAFTEYSGGRTRKPKQFERKLVSMLDGQWVYMFSGPETQWAKGLDIDLVDKCHDIQARPTGFFKS